MLLFDALGSLVNMSRKMNRIKDSITLGLASGFLSSIVMDTTNMMLYRAKKTEMLMGHLAGSMIFSKIRLNQRKNFILGEIFHLITGSVLGIPIVYLLKKTGKDQYLLKGAASGLLTWGILYDFGQRMGFFNARAHLTRSHYSSLITNIIYGVVAAQAVVTLGDPSLFPNKGASKQSQLQTQNSEALKGTDKTIMWTPDNEIEAPNRTMH